MTEAGEPVGARRGRRRLVAGRWGDRDRVVAVRRRSAGCLSLGLRRPSPLGATALRRGDRRPRASTTPIRGDFPYSVGGGVAVLDCDADGRPDLYLAGGSGPAALYRNESPVGGSLRFARIADPAADLTGVIGAYPIDMDGDGVVDLVVLRDGENVALRGLGGCRFERANEAWGLTAGTR